MMDRNRFFTVTGLIIVSLICCQVGLCAQTWHLEQGQEFKELTPGSESSYVMAVSQIKKLVSQGQTENVVKALDKLKADFPEIAGPDLDAFIKAEILFSKGKFGKAGRAYEKFLSRYPRSGLHDAVLDRQFSIATAYLGGQKIRVLKIFKIKGYSQGEAMMEKISDRVGQSPLGVRAAVSVAESLEARGKFEEAHLQWSLIRSRWSTGQIAKESLLAMGRCMHGAYKGPAYTGSNLISAKGYYEDFSGLYPVDSGKLEIDKKLALIEEQLAYKNFSIGHYYDRTNNEYAADYYYQIVTDNWPKSAAAKMVVNANKAKSIADKKEKGWKSKTLTKLEKWFL